MTIPQSLKKLFLLWLNPRSRLWGQMPLFFFIGLALIAGVLFFTGLDTAVYQCDEYSYLNKSYFLDLYLKGQFKDNKWQGGDATDQTKLMEYLYGIPAHVLYGRSFLQLAQEESAKYGESYINYGDWAITYGQPANELKVSQKLKNVLIGGRMIATLFTVSYLLLVALALFWLFKRSYLLTGLGFVFLASHPIIVIHGKQILADSALNAFLILGFLLILKWWQSFWQTRPNARQIFRINLALGLVGGLAAAAKFNGFLSLILSGAVVVLATCLSLKKRSISTRRQILILGFLSLLLQVGIAFSVFILLHPGTWDDPIGGIRKFSQWRWWITNYFRNYFSEDNIASWTEGVRYILLRTAGYMPGVGSIGFRWEERYHSLNPGWYLIPNLFLFVFGIWELLRKTVTERISKLYLPTLIWVLGMVIIVSIYLKLDWTRYYWPLFAAFVIADSFGLQFWLEHLKKLWGAK